MKKWLVISNCRTIGLTNAFSFLNPGTHIDGCDVVDFRNRIENWSIAMHEYEHIFMLDQVYDLRVIDYSPYHNIRVLPMIEFRGYHPDTCYIVIGHDSNIGFLKTKLSDYNSILIYACYLKGYNPDKAISVFNGYTFKSVGYFDVWKFEKNNLISRFDKAGLDGKSILRKWSMHDAFMYSINHPKIGILTDLARLASEKVGASPIDLDFYPHDNLANGPAFPVYPEIADQLSIKGSYNFKIGGYYKVIDLAEFVESSYAAYDAHRESDMRIHSEYEDQFNRVMQFL